MTDQDVVWLDEITESAPAQLGRKGDNLATMRRAGFSVPSGFCVTTHAYQAFLAANDLTTLTDAKHPAANLVQGQYPEELREAIVAAYRRLAADALAVRSSATTEDLPTASFAGQQETFLNVRAEADLLDSVRRCWASLWSERAVAYRREHAVCPSEANMAVVVQAMIPCDVAGVAFSRDPLSGAETVVIESTPGLGEGVVGGSAEVERYTFHRSSQKTTVPPGGLLRIDQIQSIAETLIALERLFGQPQDVEWGLWQNNLYLFQSRPITVCPGSFFTEVIADDEYLWTGGFLNERFPQPVSPLGWTLIRDLLEPVAFRDPLRFMGFRTPAGMPITKLRCGHPFVNVRVFQILYKPFPDRLLPEDARRYFPRGDTELRREAPYPCCLLDPRFVASMLWHFVQDPANWSPTHNSRHWLGFVGEHDRVMRSLRERAEALDETAGLSDAWILLTEAQALSRRLLAIHRWSLSCADIFYSLLRRSLVAWLGKERATALCAQLVAGSPNKSVELNRALLGLADESDWRAFMDSYGHRSFSLDICHPTFTENADQVKRIAESMSSGFDLEDRSAQRLSAESEVRHALRKQPRGWFKAHFFNLVLSYARRYMPLREDQRFYWQKTLAFERRLMLWIGKRLVERGWLERPEDVFFATLDELRRTAAGGTFPGDEIARRRKEFARLQQAFKAAPQLSYPYFLRGNQPLEIEIGAVLRGQPVSPGLARGPARLVTTPDQFDRILPGDILVTRGADPGWTLFFGRIAGLVMEVGGQLSHGAVVAREYGLPAVAGIPGVTERLEDGQEIVVDGLSGTVTRCQ